jgi:hypothetical protein
MAYRTFDSATIDSTGVFLIGQLEQLDRTIHEPLQSFTWSRDINVRTDVTMAHDFSSFTNQAIASIGGLGSGAAGKAWISKESSNLPNVGIDLGKTTSALFPWGMELDFTVFELESAMLLGQGIDEQKFSAMKRKHQQDTDIQVYLGDAGYGVSGLFNNANIPTNYQVSASGTGSSTLWINKTVSQILQDVNGLLQTVWAATAYTKCPEKLAISPAMFAYLASQIVSSAGNVSILEYIRNNSISLAQNNKPLEIVSVKWLTGTNNGNALGLQATDAMFAYTQEHQLVRFPMVPLQGLPVQFRGVSQIRPYVGKLGVVEWVFPETGGFAYGIN